MGDCTQRYWFCWDSFEVLQIRKEAWNKHDYLNWVAQKMPPKQETDFAISEICSYS
jgi:hypothetical protein